MCSFVIGDQTKSWLFKVLWALSSQNQVRSKVCSGFGLVSTIDLGTWTLMTRSSYRVLCHRPVSGMCQVLFTSSFELDFQEVLGRKYFLSHYRVPYYGHRRVPETNIICLNPRIGSRTLVQDGFPELSSKELLTTGLAKIHAFEDVWRTYTSPRRLELANFRSFKTCLSSTGKPYPEWQKWPLLNMSKMPKPEKDVCHFAHTLLKTMVPNPLKYWKVEVRS